MLLLFFGLLLFFISTRTSVATSEENNQNNAPIPNIEVPQKAVQPPQFTGMKSFEGAQDKSLQVQAVLSSGKGLLISAPIDGSLKSVPFENGDAFKKNDILIRYDCAAEKAKVAEISARVSISDRQVVAYERLKKMDMVSDVEYISIIGQHKQNKALLTQARTRLDMCVIIAPFDGRIQDIQVDVNEVVKSGRFLMKINSNDPLNVEMLVPSVWLRWLNVGTLLDVYIKESAKVYAANVIRIHGEVDPVSQSVRIVAKINSYEEELLPGMSGRATFEKSSRKETNGFMGLKTSVYNGQ